MGAASYVQGKRFTRPRKTKEYYQWLENGAIIDCDITPIEEELLETLMLGLRLASGLNLKTLTQKFGTEKVEKIKQCLHPYFDQGWVQIMGEKLRLTDPDGFLFSNVVLADLFDKMGE
jgi:oxygen-independent coproporphyrinogen-3 oxidase